jgi:hypothetical protein
MKTILMLFIVVFAANQIYFQNFNFSPPRLTITNNSDISVALKKKLF